MKKISALLLALTFLLCAGCGASSGSSDAGSGSSASSSTAMSPQAPEQAWDAWEDSADWELNTNGSGSTGAEGGELPKSVDLSEKIIYSAALTIETLEFDASVSALEQMTSALGGFVESSQVSGFTRRQSDGTTRVVDRSAYYTIRVPASRFQEALHQAGELGSVTGSSTNAENITSRFTDQEARKHSLEVQEERLLSMLEKAEDVETLVALEARLSEVRYEIESIERTLRNWQNEVDYSTVSVTLQEVAVYTPTVPVQRTFGERLSGALSHGWTGFVESLQDFAVFLVESLPVLVLLAAVAVCVVLLVRRILRRRRSARAYPSAATKDEPEKKDEP